MPLEVRTTRRLVVAGALSLAAATVAAQPVPLGEAFIAHEDDALDQTRPRIGVSATDAFLVVWEDINTPAGHGIDVIGRKFLPDGTPLGEFEVQQSFSGPQEFAELAMNGSGDFAVIWAGQADQDGARQTKVRNSTSNGTVLGPEERANEILNTGAGSMPSKVCMDADDSFGVVWTRSTPTFRIFATAGNPLTGDLEISTGVDPSRPKIACLPDGRRLVAWDDHDTEGTSVFGQIFSQLGEPISKVFRLNEIGANNQTAPHVAGVESGGFVAAWVEQGPTDNRIEIRRFSSEGTPLGGDRLVFSTVVALPVISALVAAPDGASVVTWTGATPGLQLGAAELTRIGTLLPGGPTFPTEDPSASALAVGVGSRTYALAWHEDGFVSTDAMVRRYVRRAIFSDDFETGDTDGWSAAAP